MFFVILTTRQFCYCPAEPGRQSLASDPRNTMHLLDDTLANIKNGLRLMGFGDGRWGIFKKKSNECDFYNFRYCSYAKRRAPCTNSA